MNEPITINLDGEDVAAQPGESLWRLAKRLGIRIPHLCHLERPGYRPDGNCRACLVEIEGERTLAAACHRQVSNGMVVRTGSERAVKARRMVFELLAADMPAERRHPETEINRWADKVKPRSGRFVHRLTSASAGDESHPAISVDLSSCIQCGLCLRACREVQSNDVIGLAGRGADSRVVFDVDRAMGESSCVGCGECVQACPTDALLSKDQAADGRPAEREVESLCPYCGVGCQVTFQVRNDAIVGVDGRNGPSNLGRLCVKGRYGMDYVRSPRRLTVPLIRREDAPKSAALEAGIDDALALFREADWDEALDVAARGLRRIRDDHGGQALAGFGSAKGSNEEAYLFQKLVRAGFRTNNVDHCTRLCHASSVAALIEGIGSGAVTAPFTDVSHADVIIVIGARPAENHPVAATFIKDAAKGGAKLIVMDPRGQDLDRHASHVLNFTPGRDVALLNAMLHVIVTEGLTDDDYIANYTEGFDDLAAHLADFSPEKMAAYCGIAAPTIREVARTYATADRAVILWGMGISQHIHGTDNARCLIALALATGHIGRRGTGLHPLRGQNNVQGASDSGLIPMFLPNYRSVADPDARAFFEKLWKTELDPVPGLTVVEILNAATRGDVKGLYVMGENPAMSDPDTAHARAALANLEHLVVQDIFLTETAWFADVVLPASAFPEKTGSFTNTNRQVQLGRKCLDLPGQARADLELIFEIGLRMEVDLGPSAVADVYEEMRQAMPPLQGISFARLESEDSVTYPCSSTEEQGREVLFGDGFPRPGGRARFVPSSLTPPAETPDTDYPMVLTTGRLLEHWHTGAMTRHATVLDRLQPEAMACLNPKELRKLNIKSGQTIRVETRRGRLELPCRADGNVPPGMIFIPFCYSEAPANLLTHPALDPDGKIPGFKHCAARISGP